MEQVAVFELFKGLSVSSDNLLLFSFGGSFDIPIRFDFPFVSPKMANRKITPLLEQNFMSVSFLKKSSKVSLCTCHIPCNILDIFIVLSPRF